MATPNPALEQFIRSIPLFSLVEPADMAEVLRLFRPVELESGAALFREGDPGKEMYVLGEGAEVSISSGGGGSDQKKQVVVAYARKGDVIGEMALVDDGPRSGSAVVTHSGHAHLVDAQEFHAMRGTYVPAAFKVLRQISIDLCARLRATNERIVPSGGHAIGTPVRTPGPRPEVTVIERFPSFKGLPAVVKFALAQKLELIEVDEMTPIFGEGEPNDGAYFILEGEVSVGRNGKTLASLPAGSMFGVVACVDDGLRSASCLTTGPAKLLRMSDRDFDQLFASGHRFAYQMVDLVARQLVQHVRDANLMLPLPGKSPGTAKLAKPISGLFETPSGITAAPPAAPAPAAEEFEEEVRFTDEADFSDLELENALPLELEMELGDFETPVDPQPT